LWNHQDARIQPSNGGRGTAVMESREFQVAEPISNPEGVNEHWNDRRMLVVTPN